MMVSKFGISLFLFGVIFRWTMLNFGRVWKMIFLKMMVWKMMFHCYLGLPERNPIKKNTINNGFRKYEWLFLMVKYGFHVGKYTRQPWIRNGMYFKASFYSNGTKEPNRIRIPPSHPQPTTEKNVKISPPRALWIGVLPPHLWSSLKRNPKSFRILVPKIGGNFRKKLF